MFSLVLYTEHIYNVCSFLWLLIYTVSLQPSLLAMALLCYEAQEQHDPEHTDKIPEALKSLQLLLNVSTTIFKIYVYNAVECSFV